MDFILCSITTLLSLLCFFAVVSRRWRRRSPPLPPGPTGFPLVGSLFSLDPDLHTYFASLAKTYGPIFSIKLGTKLGIVISSPAIAKEVLQENDAIFANRDVPAVAHVIAYGGSDIAWSPYGPTWRMLRKVCVREMLSKASLDGVYKLRRREMRAMVVDLKNSSGKAVDVGDQMFLTVMNVITSTLWGGTVEGEEGRSAVGKEFREVVSEITELLGQPNLSDFFQRLRWMDLQGIERKMKKYLQRFDGIFKRIIEKKKKKEGDEGGVKDFLDFMLKLEKEGADDANKSSTTTTTTFTMTHVKALLMDMVVGGTETASNTVEWAMAEMMKKPEIMRRAQEEVDKVVGKDTIVEESHISKLPYLGAVIKEVLRLHPALPLLVPHCPSSPSTIAGFYVPQGSRVFVNVWAIHRDPCLWENPLEFNPERFLGLDKGKWDYSGNDFSYLPFGSGRRICAGISMAERMVGYALASLLHGFDWELPSGCKLDLAEKFGIVLKKAEPLVAIPTPRLSHDLQLYI
ncbi:Cytochrome P450 E-class group I protein [Dioscorea alata]|uniref:Cytochrome P450 E-class group I protein n=1 Tax=Dioscorea alata TaxID=55571 RepID=A0ACB7V4C9_DIOAL|nr:Cytochrome P450 E-class group I protein [Dioscorea alata]